ncbi:MAG: phytoene/squalene synthase family protein [Thermoguttaceae bacterium]
MMNPSRDLIEASYAYCRRMSRQAGSSFHAGFLLLPPAQRRAMWALYAFMRHTDDLADAPSEGQSRHESLAAWRSSLCQALQEDAETNRGLGTSELSCSPHLPAETHELILPALADVVRQFAIPPAHLFAAIDGVEMDLDGRGYETFEELEQYCERVASAVGYCCIHIWGLRGIEAIRPARQAGIALQLTNILRDLREDAAAGRVYLPGEDLRQVGYSAEDLRAGVGDERFRRLMAMEIARARRLYAEGAELLDWLAPTGRRIFGLLMATYRSLLDKIAGDPTAVLHRRVAVGRLKRLGLLARWSLWPPRRNDPR